jgi:excisionase family DNA binding protein
MIKIDFDEAKLAEVVRSAVAEAMASFPARSEPPPADRKILYSIRELSEFLGCSTVTAQKMKNEGRIPYRQVGRKVMFDSVEILRAMEKGKKKIR